MKSTACATTTLLLAAMTSPSHATSTISAGGNQSCAVKDSQLFCWGNNDSGQLGDGTKVGAKRPVRVPDPGNDTWISVSAGIGHTCAMTSPSGRLYCWGANDHGELGNGTLTSTSLPLPVLSSNGSTTLEDVSDVSVGSKGSCAITEGKIACWGDNSAGQLGDNSTSPSSLPVPLSNPTGIVELSGGVVHACAISDTSQQLYCWGDNYFGQLGDGTKNDSSVPLQILRPALAVSVADNVTCAIGVARPDETRRLLCWGQNHYGQLGNGSNVDSANPVVVLDPTGASSLKNILSISVGEFSVCAIDSDGHAYCWGLNDYGELGDGTRNDSTLPVVVKNPDGSGQLEDVVEISTGYRHSCARKSDGTVLCWGRDEGSGIGDGGSGDRQLPVVIDFDTIFSDGFEQN